MATAVQITFDCADPARLAEFWAETLGYQVQPPPPGFDSWPDALRAWGVPEEMWGSRSAAVDPVGAGPRLFFQRVPEGKTAKNRVHLDVKVGGADPGRRERIDGEVDRLTGIGAGVLGPVEELGTYCVVLRDPEGNEFCVD